MKFDGFDWDAGNAVKCQELGVSIAEIESVFLGEPRVGPDLDHSKVEQRFRAIGRTKEGAASVCGLHRETSRRRHLRQTDQRALHAQKGDRRL